MRHSRTGESKLIDASIWRSKGELVKAMVRKRASTAPPAEPELVPAAASA